MIIQLLLLCFIQSQSPVHDSAECKSAVVGRFPIHAGQVDEIPEARTRFELRERCPEGTIEVLIFERGAAEPSFRYDTKETFPELLFHRFNVLLLQCAGGSAGHVYVFEHNGGNNRLALEKATKENVSVRVEADSVVLSVPVIAPFTVDGTLPPTPPPTEYKFNVEIEGDRK